MENCLKSIDSKPITFNNASPTSNWELLPKSQVKYVEYIIITRDASNLGASRKEVIKFRSDIEQENLYVQADNRLDCLIQEKRLPIIKMHGQVIKSQEMITEK